MYYSIKNGKISQFANLRERNALVAADPKASKISAKEAKKILGGKPVQKSKAAMWDFLLEDVA